MDIPYNGASTAQFYVLETTPGVTPDSPAWLPLRSTGGIPQVTRDALVSAELGNGREVSNVRLGNRQITGEYAIELSQSSQDDLIAAALTSDWVAGETEAGIEVTVDSVSKTFTRTSGDFTQNTEVGDLVYFADLTGDNAKPFLVSAVTALVITGASIQHTLTDETVTTDYQTADKIGTGNLCKTVSILTWMRGKCDTPDAYLITRGVEFSGYTIEQAVNAMVTGSLPFIGRSQEKLAALPAGSTFPVTVKPEAFSSVDVSAFDGDTPLELINTFTITNDNAASAQFELGNNSVAFVERGMATNTFSLAGALNSLDSYDKFLNETELTLHSVLSGVNGAMSFSLKDATYTAATIDIGGAESLTVSIEGQATGTALSSSIVIQRIVY